MNPNELTLEEFAAALSPGSRMIDAESAEGRRLRRTIARGLVHLTLREVIRAVQSGHRGRRAGEVQQYYQHWYKEEPLEVIKSYGRPGRAIPFRFGSEHIAITDARYPLRLITERLGKIIAAQNPREVCEVGCGHGRNLFYLANRMPSIEFSGYELSAAAVNVAQRLQQLDLPCTEYGRLYRLENSTMDNVRRIRFEQASAFKLPAADESFDLVFTSAALEQMQDGLDDALAEIRRVARRHVLLYEPFGDYNDSLGRLYLWSRNYFRLRTSDLARHGLRVVRIWRSLPVKPTFAYAFALCERA